MSASGPRGADPRSFGLSESELRQLGYSVRSADGGAGLQREPTGEAPRRRRRPGAAAVRAVMTVIAMLLTGWAASPRRTLPDATPASAPDTSFSSARAMALLVDLASHPRPTGSPENDRVREALIARLDGLGWSPSVQTATALASGDSADATAATVRNVVARLPGADPTTRAVAVIVPFDGGGLSPAAAQSGLGMAVTLEVARALSAGPALGRDIMVVLTDGDARANLGTRAFTEQHPWASEIAVAVSVGARSGRGTVFAFPEGPDAGRIVELLTPAGGHRDATSWARSGDRRPPAYDRLSGLRALGASTLELEALAGSTRAGLPQDTFERVSERSLQHAGARLLTTLRRLGVEDRETGDATSDRGRVRAWLPILGPFQYPAIWSLPIAAAPLLLLSITALVLRRRVDAWKGVTAGAVVAGAAIGLTALAAGRLVQIVADVHPEHGFVDGMVYNDGPHLLALVWTALAVVSVAFVTTRRRFASDEVLFGAALAPVILMAGVAVVAPAAMAALVIPASIGVFTVSIVSWVGPARATSVPLWLVRTALTCLALAMAMPTLELLTYEATLHEAAWLGATFAAAAILLLPAIDLATRPRWWVLPTLSLAAAGALVGANLPIVQGEEDHPVPSTLVYLTDEAEPVLLPVRVDVDSASGPLPRRMLGEWLTVPGPGESWARSLVVGPPDGTTDPGPLLMAAEERFEIAGAGPVSVLAPPTVRPIAVDRSGARTRVSIAVTSGVQGEMLGIVVPEGVDAKVSRVGSQNLVAVQQVRRLSHWGRPEGGALEVELSIDARLETVDLLIIEHHLRPEEVFGEDYLRRSEALVPNVVLGSDRVIQRTPVRVAVPAEAVEPVDGTR